MGCTNSSVKLIKEDSQFPARNDVLQNNEIRPADKVPTNNPSSIDKIVLSSGLIYYEAADNSKNIFSLIKKGAAEKLKELINEEKLSSLSINLLLNVWNATPLIVALQYNRIGIALVLLNLAEVGNINHRDEKGSSALLHACLEGNEDVVDRLLSLGVAIDIEATTDAIHNHHTDSSMICTPLSVAVCNDHYKIVRKLLDHSAIHVDRDFPFPTVKSIRKKEATGGNGNTEEKESLASAPIPSLAKFESDRRLITGCYGVTPVLLACAYGRLSVVTELLLRNCKLTVQDSEHSNILHYLARAKENALEILLEIRKKLSDQEQQELVEQLDCNGDSPVHVACENKRDDVLSFLLEFCSGSPSTRNSITWKRPLHVAVKRKARTCVKLLLDYGADPLVLDKSGESPAHIATSLKDKEIKQMVADAAVAWESMRSPRKSFVESVVASTPPSVVQCISDVQPSETVESVSANLDSKLKEVDTFSTLVHFPKEQTGKEKIVPEEDTVEAVDVYTVEQFSAPAEAQYPSVEGDGDGLTRKRSVDVILRQHHEQRWAQLREIEERRAFEQKEKEMEREKEKQARLEAERKQKIAKFETEIETEESAEKEMKLAISNILRDSTPVLIPTLDFPRDKIAAENLEVSKPELQQQIFGDFASVLPLSAAKPPSGQAKGKPGFSRRKSTGSTSNTASSSDSNREKESSVLIAEAVSKKLATTQVKRKERQSPVKGRRSLDLGISPRESISPYVTPVKRESERRISAGDKIMSKKGGKKKKIGQVEVSSTAFKAVNDSTDDQNGLGARQANSLAMLPIMVVTKSNDKDEVDPVSRLSQGQRKAEGVKREEKETTPAVVAPSSPPRKKSTGPSPLVRSRRLSSSKHSSHGE